MSLGRTVVDEPRYQMVYVLTDEDDFVQWNSEKLTRAFENNVKCNMSVAC
jgi:hypothetical protein